MSAATILKHLQAAGLALRSDGDRLVVSPRDLLSDELLELIRENKAAILDELATQASRVGQVAARNAAPVLSDFRAALLLGRLHVCCNCHQFSFAAHASGMGNCRRFNVEAWPFVPFWCSGFQLSGAPVAPEFVPDRISGKERRSAQYNVEQRDRERRSA